MLKAIALLQSNAVRDVQVCTSKHHDPLDDDSWHDMPVAEVYIGVFEAETVTELMTKAATDIGNIPENVRLIFI